MIDYLRMRWHQWALCRLTLHDYDGDIRRRLNPRTLFDACIWCDRRRLLSYRGERQER